MQDNLTNVLLAIAGLVSTAIGYFFAVPPVVLWIAGGGAALGVAFSHTSGGLYAMFLIFSGVIMTAFGLQIIDTYFHFSPQALNGMAFFAPFVGICSRRIIMQRFPDLILAIFDRLENFIRDFGAPRK